MMKNDVNIILCGIGGEGLVLMSNILGEACRISGKNVISGEMHGLAQRSGSVIIHMRIGEDILSPLIPPGEADIILSLEMMEALRYLYYLKPGGSVITNSRLVHPPGITHQLIMGDVDGYVGYDEVLDSIKRSDAKVVEVKALSLAKKAGEVRAQNVVMIGALSAALSQDPSRDDFIEAISGIVPKKAREDNIKAFELGEKAWDG